jgi:hypothetical protein
LYFLFPISCEVARALGIGEDSKPSQAARDLFVFWNTALGNDSLAL